MLFYYGNMNSNARLAQDKIISVSHLCHLHWSIIHLLFGRQTSSPSWNLIAPFHEQYNKKRQTQHVYWTLKSPLLNSLQSLSSQQRTHDSQSAPNLLAKDAGGIQMNVRWGIRNVGRPPFNRVQAPASARLCLYCRCPWRPRSYRVAVSLYLTLCSDFSLKEDTERAKVQEKSMKCHIIESCSYAVIFWNYKQSFKCHLKCH